MLNLISPSGKKSSTEPILEVEYLLPSDGILIGFIAPSPPPPYKAVAVAKYQYLEERKGLVPAHNWLEL